MTKARHRSCIAITMLAAAKLASAYTLTPRWGHAATYIASPPSILIQGGKTDTTGQTYSSAANTADTILISLNASFTTYSPPSTLLPTLDAPSTAFHTLSTLGNGGSTYSILAFGGDGGAEASTPTGTDSAWFATVDTQTGSATWKQEDSSWENQPMRRLHHAAAGPGSDGKIYFTGGAKGDGSGQAFADVYSYDVSSSTFTSLPSLPQGLYHHSTALLSNGTLIVLGGVVVSSETGNPEVAAPTTIHVLNTMSSNPAWDSRTLSGGPTTGRRGASLVLYSSGDKALYFGGGNAALDTAVTDVWEIDFSTGSWSQISASASSGPSGRFDHSAVSVGSDQILIFGGYAGDTPADASVYLWDGPTGSWTAALSQHPTQTTTGVTLTGATASTGSPTESTPAIGTGITIGATGTDSLQSFKQSASGTTPSESSAATAGHKKNEKVLTTSAKVALIVCGVAIGAVILLGFLYRYRRRQRQKSRFGTWGVQPSKCDRPFKKSERGTEALIEKFESEPAGTPASSWGLGPFATRVVGSLSSTLRRGPRADPYAPLEDESAYQVNNLARSSTRKVGNGIRLIGPRAPRPKYTQHMPAPLRISTSRASSRSSRNSIASLRRDMLHDEDSRNFSPIEEEKWSSARSILGHDDDSVDPFEDGDNMELPRPIRGGPVPTPDSSIRGADRIDESNVRRYRDPFDENGRRRSTDLFEENHNKRSSVYGDLLPPPPGYSEESVPRSARSGLSGGSSTDAEEGVVEHAHIISPTRATLFSSVETSYATEPTAQVRRRESLFKRVARDGLSSFLYRSGSTNTAAKFLDIRDPTPAPELLPLDTVSRPLSLDVSEPRFPPIAFKGFSELAPSHSHGPSLSSIHSARSMRDMVIIQRDTAGEPSEIGVIGTISDMESDIASLQTIDHGSLSSTRPPSVLDQISELGESSVEQGRPPEVPQIPLTTSGPQLFITPPTLRCIDRPSLTASPSSGISTTTTPQHVSEPPSGSPLPNKLLSHRRPVREVVNSINKRGGGVPSGLSASTPPTPLSATCAKPSGSSAPPAKKRPVTMYEAVKREKLMVTNPDKKEGQERKSSG